MNDNIPTPETDAVIRNIIDEFPLNGGHEVWFERFHMLQDFTLSLERRLIEVQRERDEVWKLADVKAEEAGMFRAERDEALAKVAELTKRLEYANTEYSFALKQRDDQINEVNRLTKRIEMLTKPRPMDTR